MKQKIMSILILLVVVFGFSGVASAATHEELVTPAYNESVLVTPAYNETVPEVNETIHHDEVSHDVQVVVVPPSETKVFDHYLVNGAYSLRDGTQVAYSGNGPYFGGDGRTLSNEDVNKWAAWIYSNGPNVTGGWGSWSPYYNVTFNPGVYESMKVVDQEAWDELRIISPAYIIEHSAIYDIIFHDAVYKTVEDTVVPVVEPVKKVVKSIEETIPMQNTGGSVIPLGIALVLILCGLGIALRRRE